MAVNCTQDFRHVGTASWSNLGEKVELSGEIGISVKDALIRSKANYDVNLQPIVALTPELVEAMKHDKTINAGDLMKYVIEGRKAISLLVVYLMAMEYIQMRKCSTCLVCSHRVRT